MPGSKIKACKPLRNDLKSCQRYENDLSVCRLVLNCPFKIKNEVKPLTESAAKCICMGKWPVPTGGFYLSGFRKAQDVQIFSGAPFATNVILEKY